MFSEYASKFLSQSANQSAGGGNTRNSEEAPLFLSSVDEPDQPSGSVYPSIYRPSAAAGVSNGALGSISTQARKYVPFSYLRAPSPERMALYQSDGDDDDEGEDDVYGDYDINGRFLENARAIESSTSTVGLNDRGRTQDDDNDDPPHDIALDDASTKHLTRKLDSGIGMRPYDPSIEEEHIENENNNDNGTPLNTETDNHNDTEFVPPLFSSPNYTRFDEKWATLYIVSVSIAFATSLMVWSVTRGVYGKVPLGDTMYTILRASWSTLFINMCIAMIVSYAWVFAMRYYTPLLVHASIVLVPVGLLIIFVYSNVMSAKGPHNHRETQDIAMRWSSLLPLLLGVSWSLVVYKGRHTVAKSLGMIQLSCTILSSQSPAILLFSAGIVGFFVVMTILWINMFSTLFLEGDPVNGVFVLSFRAWMFAIYYILLYLWSWGVVNGIQRATISASVSHWYFYRHQAALSSHVVGSSEVIKTGLRYAVTAQFGTICFSSLICLFLRLPLLVLPRRFVTIVQMVIYNVFVNAPALSLTNSLALTNAVINSQGLVDSARTISSLKYLGNSSGPSGAPGSADAVAQTKPTWYAYRLAKMLLSAARLLTAMAMGFVAWAHAAKLTNGGNGSLYGYIVGMFSGFIGWFILGATEGTLSIILDATYVCFALDNIGGGGHCNEADRQFKVW